MAEDQDPVWHQALAFAVTGQHLAGLGRQRQPDLPSLARMIREHSPGIERLSPAHPVPPALMRGIGAAQFVAALTQLRRQLGADRGFAPVVTDRPLTADERRLVSEVPPHHGS